MPRYGPKTYSKKAKNSADEEFDELFNDVADTKGNNLPTRAASSHRRWGNMSYTSSRVTRKSAMQAKEPDAAGFPSAESPRKRHCRKNSSDDSFGDPFSFDSDDDKGSPRKRTLQIPPAKSNQIVDKMPKVNVSSGGKTNSVVNAKETKEDVENAQRISLVANVNTKVNSKDTTTRSKQGVTSNKIDLTTNKLPVKRVDARSNLKPVKVDTKTVKSKLGDSSAVKQSKTATKSIKLVSVPSCKPKKKKVPTATLR